MAVALAEGLIDSRTSVLDYGCGHGADIKFLSSRKIKARGWDPHYRPDARHLRPADIVNLGYVLNVIEDMHERGETLRRAYELAKRALVVSVRVDRALAGSEEFGDGWLTGSGTFQKLYTQTEFRDYVEVVLGQRPHVVGLGIAYVFRDTTLEQGYLARRAFTRRLEYRTDLIEEFARNPQARRYVALANKLGRPPLPEEFRGYSQLLDRFGSPTRLERLLLHHVDRGSFEGSRASRREDILTYLAMLRFQSIAPPPIGYLPSSIREDIKAIWPSYSAAKDDAEKFLFSLGQLELVRAACSQSPVGKLLPTDLYVHRSAVDELPSLVRLLIFAAQQVVGQVEYDIVKIGLDKPAVSFVGYGSFDEDPHPALQYSVRVYLPRGAYDIRDYRDLINPPILHRKETFVARTYPGYSTFHALTQREEELGLLSSTEIGYRRQWQELLQARGLVIQGHEVVPAATAGEVHKR